MELISMKSVKEALQHLHTAFQADCRQKYKVAVVEYMEGAPQLVQVAREEGLCSQSKQFLKARCQQYLDRIQAIKTGLDSEDTIPLNTAVDRTQPNMDGLDEDSIREAIQSWTELPYQHSLSEMKGAEQVKEFLWTNIILPLLCPGLPGSVTRVKRGILLYGLPGTGKTMLLCALAAAVACPVVRVTACDLITTCYGAERMVQRLKDLFAWAKQNQPCVVCLDDLDVLYSPDHDAEDSVTRMVREELILQLKPVSTDYQVTVIGATQKPWHLATNRGKLQRKFDRRFHLTLPDKTERVQIFTQQMTDIVHKLSQNDLDLIGQLTSGFTGADISVLARSCAMAPVRILQGATHFRKITMTLTQNGTEVTQEMMSPCDADTPGAVQITWEFLNPERIDVPQVTMAMVEKEIAHGLVRPSCSELDLQKIKEWAEEFGQD